MQKQFTYLIVFLCTCFCVTSGYDNAEAYCIKWHASKFDKCLSNIKQSEHFTKNVDVLVKQWNANDFSVDMSYYLAYSRYYYEKNMVMETNAIPVGPRTNSVAPSCELTTMNHEYPKLNTLHINNANTRFVSYPISGALDLMYTAFKKLDSSFDISFSVDMIRNILGENATIYSVMNHLKSQGVCEEEDYDEEVIAGRALSPLCCRYKISSFRQIRGLNSCTLANRIDNGPLYAELAVNPYFYQLHCKKSKEAIRKAYYRYTIAGIITGYDTRKESNQFWTLLVRRHGTENNKINVVYNMASPFGHMTGRVFTVEADMVSYSDKHSVRGGMCGDQGFDDIITTGIPTTAPIVPAVPTTAPIIPTVPTTAPIPPTVSTNAPSSSLPERLPNEGDIGYCGYDYYTNGAGFTPLRATVVDMNTLSSISSLTTHIYFPNDSFNELNAQFLFTRFTQLRYICVSDRVGVHVQSFIIKDLPELRGIYVGLNSVTSHNGTMTALKCGQNKGFELNTLNKLEWVSIGAQSFGDFVSFSVNDTPLLNTLFIGEATTSSHFLSDNFYCAPQLDLSDDLHEMKSIMIGNYAFFLATKVVFKSMNTLNSIRIGASAMAGAIASSKKFEMIDLPLLTTLVARTGSIHSFVIEADNVPSIVTTFIGSNTFLGTQKIYTKSYATSDPLIRLVCERVQTAVLYLNGEHNGICSTRY